jgi:hypothetical protein
MVMGSGSGPVRLRVAYRRPEVAIGEFTRSVARRTVSLRSPRSVAVGTQFIFELLTEGVSEPVEVLGKVERVLPLGREYLISVRYDPGTRRGAIDQVLEQMRRAHAQERARMHLRVPLNLPAQSDLAYSPMFVIRDLSRGGMGVAVEAPAMPREIHIGVLVFAEIRHGEDRIGLHGEVVWAASTTDPTRPFTYPSFGVRFGALRDPTVAQVDRLLALKVLPPPEVTVRLSFGMDALKRIS